MSQGMVTPEDAGNDFGFSLNGLDEKDFDALPKEMLKVFKEVEKLVDKISKDWGKTLKETKDTAKIVEGEASGGTGGKMSGSLGKFSSTVGKVGMGAMAIGAAYMSMAPNTMDAVTQRMTADTFAGLSGIGGGSRGAIRQANKMVGGGATSAMGPTMAQATLFSKGMAAGTVGANNIMNQMAGMTAFSGMSNQQAAGAVSSLNGMTMLRMGINLRDSNGEIKKTDALINKVYQFIFRGQKLTKAQAAMVYAPRSKSNITLQQISEGDPDLFNFLASGIVARASAGSDKKFSAAMESKDPNKMLDLMGVDKSSPQRANYKFNTSESRKLLATEKGLVSGYNTSLNAASTLNDGYSKMAEVLGPVNDGLMNLKAILQTFPNAGGVAGGVSQIASAGMNAGMTAMMMRGGGGGAGAGGPGFFGKMGFGKGTAGMAGKFSAKGFGAGTVAAVGLNVAGNMIKGDSEKGSGRSRLGTAAKWAGNAAILNVLGPEIGVPAMILAGIAGGIFGGERGDTMNIGTGADQGAGTPTPAASPVPSGTVTTSPFGLRAGAAKRAAEKGQKISTDHKGVDYGVPSGTPVKAVADGVVEKVGSDPTGWGNYVLVRHLDGTSSRYCHLRRISCSTNQKIRKGEVVGLSGGGAKDPGRGNSTGAHLHFEIATKAGVRIDPEAWLLSSKLPSLKGYNDKNNRYEAASTLFSEYNSLTDAFNPNSLDSFLQNSADFGGITYSDLTKHYSKEELKTLSGIADNYTGKPTKNKKELMKLIAAGGFHGASLRTAYAISIAESGGRSDAKGDISLQDAKWGPSVGLFQIRSLKKWKDYNDPYRDASRLTDPRYNVEAAFTKSKHGTNFQPWTTYTGGAFAKYLNEADAMAKAAGVGGGGGSDSMNLGVAHSSTSSGRRSSSGSTLTANSNVTINLDMKVAIASSSPAEAERLVRLVGDRLKKDAELKRIASSL